MLGNLLNRSQNRAVESFPLPPRGASIQSLTGGINVTRSTLLSHVVANRCVSIISDQIGALPIQAERNGEPIPTPPVLGRPELDRTRSEFIAAAVTSLLVNGNAYILAGRRDSLGYPQNVVLLDPEAVDVKTVGGTIQYKAAGQTLNPEDVTHIRGFCLPGHVKGYGPLDLNAQAIAQALAGDQYAAQSFMTGAIPDGVLYSENEITADQAAELKNAWIAGNGGRQRGPAVISGGVKYEKLEFSSADLELLDSRRFSALNICTLFGVPAHLVQVENTTGSNTYSSVTQDSQAFVRFTLRPWIVRLEEGLSDLLPRGQRATFNLDGLLRASTLDRYNAHKVAIDAGFMTISEVRELEGLPPLETDPPDIDDDDAQEVEGE
jgi:HK97 family phage portal protein